MRSCRVAPLCGQRMLIDRSELQLSCQIARGLRFAMLSEPLFVWCQWLTDAGQSCDAAGRPTGEAASIVENSNSQVRRADESRTSWLPNELSSDTR